MYINFYLCLRSRFGISYGNDKKKQKYGVLVVCTLLLLFLSFPKGNPTLRLSLSVENYFCLCYFRRNSTLRLLFSLKIHRFQVRHHGQFECADFLVECQKRRSVAIRKCRNALCKALANAFHFTFTAFSMLAIHLSCITSFAKVVR